MGVPSAGMSSTPSHVSQNQPEEKNPAGGAQPSAPASTFPSQERAGIPENSVRKELYRAWGDMEKGPPILGERLQGILEEETGGFMKRFSKALDSKMRSKERKLDQLLQAFREYDMRAALEDPRESPIRIRNALEQALQIRDEIYVQNRNSKQAYGYTEKLARHVHAYLENTPLPKGDGANLMPLSELTSFWVMSHATEQFDPRFEDPRLSRGKQQEAALEQIEWIHDSQLFPKADEAILIDLLMNLFPFKHIRARGNIEPGLMERYMDLCNKLAKSGNLKKINEINDCIKVACLGRRDEKYLEQISEIVKSLFSLPRPEAPNIQEWSPQDYVKRKPRIQITAIKNPGDFMINSSSTKNPENFMIEEASGILFAKFNFEEALRFFYASTFRYRHKSGMAVAMNKLDSAGWSDEACTEILRQHFEWRVLPEEDESQF